jgi:hypothetical protein
MVQGEYEDKWWLEAKIARLEKEPWLYSFNADTVIFQVWNEKMRNWRKKLGKDENGVFNDLERRGELGIPLAVSNHTIWKDKYENSQLKSKRNLLNMC